MRHIKYLKKIDLLLGFQVCFTLSLRHIPRTQFYERRPGNNICSFLGDIFVIFDKTVTIRFRIGLTAFTYTQTFKVSSYKWKQEVQLRIFTHFGFRDYSSYTDSSLFDMLSTEEKMFQYYLSSVL